MSSIAKLFRESDLTFSPFVMETLNASHVADDLKREVGSEHSSEYEVDFFNLYAVETVVV